MDLNEILKAWAKVKSDKEESVLIFSAKPEEGRFSLVAWVKPQQEEVDEEGEGIIDSTNPLIHVDHRERDIDEPDHHFEEIRKPKLPELP